VSINRRTGRAWLSTFLVVVWASAAATAAGATDWPQFRGPNRDGVSKETGLLTGWPVKGPEVSWRKKLGRGYSGISVVGDRLYTLFANGDGEFAVCLEAPSGKEVWRFRMDATFRNDFGDGPRSTPTVFEGIVYVLSAKGKLHALQAKDGEAVWTRDLKEAYGAEPPEWGVATSPLVEGKLLIVDVGGSAGRSVVAFDRKTGDEIWTSQKDKAGYSAPLAITVGGLRQVLLFTATQFVSLSPDDGSLLWKQPWKTSYDVNAATPVFVPPDKVFVSTAYDVGAALYRIDVKNGQASIEELWKGRQMRNKFSSSIYLDGQIYGFDEKTLKCIDAATGDLRWQTRGLGHGSLLYADGQLIVLSEEGELILVAATPERYVERARTRVFDGRSWTVPTLAGGRLFLRDANEIVALGVSE